MDFDAKTAVDATVKWISDWFKLNGPGCNAIIGISGGKDSSITAALLVQALGKERVIGIMMPNGEQSDMDMALLLIDHLGIESHVINIEAAYNGAVKDIESAIGELSKDSLINLAPRLRMATLYAVGQSRIGSATQLDTEMRQVTLVQFHLLQLPKSAQWAACLEYPKS